MHIEQTDKPPSEWEELWVQDDHATLFLHPRWLTALTRAYPRYRAHFLTAVDGGRVRGVLPFVSTRRFGLPQFLSLPFGTHGGPVLAGDTGPEVAGALVRAFCDRAQGLTTLRFEISVFNPTPEMKAVLTAALGKYLQEFRTHLVDLTVGADRIWNDRYDKNTRNCIRMAERAKVMVAEERGTEAVKILHRFHHQQSQAWEGIPPHSLDALGTFTDTLGKDARIYIARVGGEPVAACLFLYHGKEVHPWVSGALPEARKPRAFHLLMHTALRDACTEGLSVWNFGGSGGNPKIEFFKESFAGVPVPVLRGYYMNPWVRRLRKGPAWD